MRIRELFKKFKKNNKGVTLIELIVSVVILSIAVAPLLYSFVVSTRMNATAKTKQRALNAAQSVMETFKANGLKTSNDYFTGKIKHNEEDEDGNTISVATDFLINNTASYSITDADGYYGTYHITNMTLSDNVAGNSYMPVEARTYDVDVQVSKGMVSSDIKTLDVYDPSVDYIFTEYSDEYGSYFYDPLYVANEIVYDNGYRSNDVSKVIIHSRDIYLDFNDTSASVTYKYKYSVYAADGTPLKVNKTYSTSSRVNSKMLDSDKTLRSIYFYYYPAYKLYDKSGDTYVEVPYDVEMGKDILHVNNQCSNDNVDIYVYKQADTARLSPYMAASDEMYRLYLVNENNNAGSPKCHMYDCVQDNLINIVDGSVEFSTALGSMLTWGEVGVDTYDRICVDGEYNSGATEAATITQVPLTTYVSITVYEHDKHEKALATLTSTILN